MDKRYNFTNIRILLIEGFSDEELRQVRQPVLLLTGDQDRLNPPKAVERARRTIPHLKAEIIKQAGHLLSMEQPERINSLVLDFLAGE